MQCTLQLSQYFNARFFVPLIGMGRTEKKENDDYYPNENEILTKTLNVDITK